jgi:NAD(P)-dependent dehydrogenase (short-subunit alcohol dehydrogenase family)
MLKLPFSYEPHATAMIVGVGLMGRYLASEVLNWVDLKKLVLVDNCGEIRQGDQVVPLAEYAESIQQRFGNRTEVVAEVVDITDEQAVQQLLQRHRKIHYWMHTAGVSPKPLTPPEQLTKSDLMGAFEINLWGAYNMLKQGVLTSAFDHGGRGVLLLSTSATVGSEGRASAAYEVSKAGLSNFLQLHSRYFAEEYGLILNGLAPSPLRGLMAAQNPISQSRLEAVEGATPLGGLTDPTHIASATMFFWAKECWCVGEVLTIDGGYTKHRPIFGGLG